MSVLDRLTFIGALVGAMAYEAHTVIAYICVKALLKRSSDTHVVQQGHRNRLRQRLGLTFVLVIFSLGSINFGTQLASLLDAFVNETGFPGGATAYLVSSASDVSSQISNVCGVITPLLSDGLLLWRTHIVWNRSFRVIIVPSLMYLISVGTSIAALYCNSETSNISAQAVEAIFLTYCITTISTNLLLTCLVAGKLLIVNRRANMIFGQQRQGYIYGSIATIIIESSLPYTVVGTAFTIALSLSAEASQVIFPLVSQVMCIGPLLIVWRVAKGEALSHECTNGDSIHLASITFKRTAELESLGQLASSEP